MPCLLTEREGVSYLLCSGLPWGPVRPFGSGVCSVALAAVPGLRL